MVEELPRKGFVEKMSFEPGVEERRSRPEWSGGSGDEGNDELTCVRVISLHDQQAGEVPSEADSRDASNVLGLSSPTCRPIALM